MQMQKSPKDIHTQARRAESVTTKQAKMHMLKMQPTSTHPTYIILYIINYYYYRIYD